jgi:hypothetical protein
MDLLDAKKTCEIEKKSYAPSVHQKSIEWHLFWCNMIF